MPEREALISERDRARELIVALESAVAEHHRQYHRYDGGLGWERCDVPFCREAREVMSHG